MTGSNANIRPRGLEVTASTTAFNQAQCRRSSPRLSDYLPRTFFKRSSTGPSKEENPQGCGGKRVSRIEIGPVFPRQFEFLGQPTWGPFAKLFAKRPGRNRKKSLLRLLRSDFWFKRMLREPRPAIRGVWLSGWRFWVRHASLAGEGMENIASTVVLCQRRNSKRPAAVPSRTAPASWCFWGTPQRSH